MSEGMNQRNYANGSQTGYPGGNQQEIRQRSYPGTSPGGYQTSYVAGQLLPDVIRALASGKNRNVVIQELLAKGVPYQTAEGVVTQATRVKKAAFRKQGLITLLGGIGCIIAGIVITAITYSLAGPRGTYFVTTGLFIIGAINIFRGLFRLIAG